MDEASACLESDGEDGADGLTVAGISAWLNMRGGAQKTRCRKEHRLPSSGEGHSAIGE